MWEQGSPYLDGRCPSLGFSDCSVSIFFRQGLDPPDTPSMVASLPFQGFDLPQKLGGEGRFAPEALVTRVTSQARVHVAHSRFEGAPENA